MGIKGIRDLIKRQFKGCPFETTVPVSAFAGKTIAVDAAIFVCSFKAAQKDFFEEAFIQMFSVLREFGIKPVFVFDGVSPAEKATEKQKRTDGRRAQIARVEQLEADCQLCKEQSVITPALQSIYDEKIPKSKLIHLTTSNSFSLARVEAYVKKLRDSILMIESKDYERLEQLLKLFGIPFITASGESEVLCAEFVKQGKVDAVLSRDTDVLACGAPIMLSNLNMAKKEFTVVHLDEILKCFELDYGSWLDLCIMCGTDYNDNVKHIGPVKSLALIKKHGRLEDVKEASCIPYDKIRTLFKENNVPDIPEQCPPDIEAVRRHIAKHRLKVSDIFLRV